MAGRENGAAAFLGRCQDVDGGEKFKLHANARSDLQLGRIPLNFLGVAHGGLPGLAFIGV